MDCKITPEEVVESYKKTGYQPVQVSFFQKSAIYGWMTCPLTTVAVARGLTTVENLASDDENSISLADLPDFFGMSEAEFSAFYEGVDGNTHSEVRTSEDENIRNAYDCGAASWQAVIDAGLKE